MVGHQILSSDAKSRLGHLLSSSIIFRTQVLEASSTGDFRVRIQRKLDNAKDVCDGFERHSKVHQEEMS